MSRKQVPNKTKALLQKEVRSKCPFCDNGDVDHFQVHHIDEVSSNGVIENLILLCSMCHSKITKKDISRNEVEQRKRELQKSSQADETCITSSEKSVISGNGNIQAGRDVIISNKHFNT